MLAWNSPYVLAIIIGLIAIGIYHFDQKHKKNEIHKISYVKIFVLVAGSIMGFYHFLYPTLSATPLTSSTTSANAQVGSGSLITPVPQVAQSVSATTSGATLGQNMSINRAQALRTSPVSAFTPYKSDSISVLSSGLKIREGPVPF
jgi:hypothetical protein